MNSHISHHTVGTITFRNEAALFFFELLKNILEFITIKHCKHLSDEYTTTRQRDIAIE